MILPSGETPARRLALEVTRDVRKRSAYARDLIDARRVGSTLVPEEFAYAQVLIYGVVMCQGTLDELIDRNLRSLHDIKPEVRDVLRIGAYELLFLHKPAHGGVDQGVRLTRSVVARAAGLANAVLRKMALDAEGFPWGDADTDDEAFARSYGIQRWIADALVQQYGRITAAQILAASLEAAPTYTVSNPYSPGTKFASDLSAQRVVSFIPPSDSILEIGAGRGTKTLLLQARALELTGAPTSIHTVDIHSYKERILRERLDEMHVPGVIIHTGDARDLSGIDDLPADFPTVFVDTPCSGLGTLRRHPEIRWRLTTEDIDELARLQLELLTEASRWVRPGGVLCYSTCTLLSAENERVVSAFIDTQEGRAFSIGTDTDVGGFSGWEVTEEGFLRSLPLSEGPDGHFAALLHRLSI